MRPIAALGTLALVTSCLLPVRAAVAGDTASCAGQAVTIDLSDPAAPDTDRPSSDVILGTPDFDVIFTGAGDDVVCDQDDVEGDAIYLGPGDDHAIAGSGDDLVDGGTGTDIINTGAGNDSVHGGGAPAGTREELRLGSGYDVASASSADELILAGRGIDAVYYSGVRPGHGGVTIDLATVGPQATGAGGVDELVGVEQLHGTGRGDVLRGDANDNNLRGGAGDDTIIGGGGHDRCAGNHGVDVLRSCEVIDGRR